MRKLPIFHDRTGRNPFTRLLFVFFNLGSLSMMTYNWAGRKVGTVDGIPVENNIITAHLNVTMWVVILYVDSDNSARQQD